MRDWRLNAAAPLTLRLAADARLGETDYADDHIWEMTLGGGDPPALALRTTYGLRAQEMRIFPVFVEDETSVSDPAMFATPPLVRAFYVNYLRLSFAPLEGIEVTAHYWTPDSHTVAGRFTLVNRRTEPCRLRLLLTAQLKPLAQPRPFAPFPLEEPDVSAFVALEGHTGNLDVFVALEGQANIEHTLFPVLARPLELAPNEPVFVRWVETALAVATPTDVLGSPRPEAAEASPAGPVHIRQVLAQDWDAEFTRLELHNGRLLDIETGDAAWDATLAFAQVAALRAYLSPTAHLPHPSFVLTRHPDRGYSPLGDGSDHPWQWNGQSPAEAYLHLASILHAAPELAMGVLRNYLAVQEADGFIDWKPGLAGQRNRALCLPILATLAWRIYEQTEDLTFLAEVYPGLRRFNDAWFAERYDRDEDGVPEWAHTMQTSLDNNPAFVLWQPWAQGADITQVESPDLIAYLCRECQTLLNMAQQLGLLADMVLTKRLQHLQATLKTLWQADTASYHYRDRDSHAALVGTTLFTGTGAVVWEEPRHFNPPARILIKLLGPRDARPDVEITLVGQGKSGRAWVETLRRSQVQWYFGVGTATSEKAYSQLERVEIQGLAEEYSVAIVTVDLMRQDLTLLVPLWGGAPDAKQAETLVRRTVLDPERYWRPYGLPACSAQDPAYAPDGAAGCGGLWMLGNVLVAEGLVNYGYRAEAGLLFKRLLSGMIYTLKNEQTFRETYNPEQPEGLGERNHLGGLAPVGLFMHILGVRILSPRKVFVEGRNPFPWPVTVRQRGVTVLKTTSQTIITFPTGQKTTLNDAGPHIVEIK